MPPSLWSLFERPRKPMPTLRNVSAHLLYPLVGFTSLCCSFIPDVILCIPYTSMCETAYLLTCIPYIPYKHMVRVYACVNVYLCVCLPTCLSVYRPHRYEAISFAPHQTPSTQVGAQHVAETPLMDRGGETELHRPSHGAHLHWVQSAL